MNQSMAFDRNNIMLRVALRFLGASLLVIFTFLVYVYPELRSNNLTLLFSFLFIFTVFLTYTRMSYSLKFYSLIAFSVKLIVLIIYMNNYNYILFPDSYAYIANLDKIVISGDYSFDNLKYTAETLHVGHYYYMLIPYLIFGTSKAILISNATITSIAIVLMFKVFEKSFSKKIASYVLIFSFLSMNLAFIGSFILKDPLVILMGSLILYYVVVKEKKVVIPIILSLLLVSIRIYAGFAFLLTVVMHLLARDSVSRRKRYFYSFFVVIVGLGLSALPTVQSYFNLSTSFVTENISLGLITDTLSALFKFFFAPLPVNLILNYGEYTILIFDSFFFFLSSLGLVYFILKFIKFKELRTKMWIFIIPILVHAVVLGAQYDGNSTRQRSGIFITLIAIVVIGFLYKNKKETSGTTSQKLE